VPVVTPITKLALDESAFKGIEKGLDLGQKTAESVIKGSEKAESWLEGDGEYDFEEGAAVEAHGAILRQLHALLREKDPTFGGLERVRNKRDEVLWVHPNYLSEY
jgi:hypothetical protein